MGNMSDDVRAEWEREWEWALRQEERWDDFCADAEEAPRLRKELERMREALAARTEDRDVESQMREEAAKEAERQKGAKEEAQVEAERARAEAERARRAAARALKAGPGEKKAERMDYAPMWPMVDRLLKEGGRSVPDVCGDVLEIFGHKATEKQRNSMVVQYSKRKKRLTIPPR